MTIQGQMTSLSNLMEPTQPQHPTSKQGNMRSSEIHLITASLMSVLLLTSPQRRERALVWSLPQTVALLWVPINCCPAEEGHRGWVYGVLSTRC